MTCETNRVGEDELQLIDFSEEDDYLVAFPFRDSLEDLRLSGADYLLFDHLPLRLRMLLTYDNLNECDRIKLFESINSQVLERIDQAQSESMEPRRPSFLRRSLAWDSAFFTSAGVLNPEELYMINKGFNKANSINQSPNRITTHNQTSSGTDSTVSKKSRCGDLSTLPKSTSFTSPIQKDSKVHCSYESSSSASSSKSIRRKTIPRNTKPLSSTCSSITSIEGWFSESLSLSSPEFTNNNVTRSPIGSHLFSNGPKRKIKSSGLRMPSPKIGFFDEEQPFNTNKNCLKDGKVGVGFSKLKPGGQVQKEMLKNRMNIEIKKQKDEATINMKQKQDENDQKENVCSFEDQINGLSRFFEVIDLDRDVVSEVKGGQLSVHYSRTPLAEKTEKTSGKQ
ncbi:hypothetical protein L1887_23650 [Cichorium endivia]|nr:hypothetical protein L1887_23650 [Cichorium endivia]